MRPNEKEISHGKGAVANTRAHFEMGPLASSIG